MRHRTARRAGEPRRTQPREVNKLPRIKPTDSAPSAPSKPVGSASDAFGRCFRAGGCDSSSVWHALHTGSGFPFTLGSARMRLRYAGLSRLSVSTRKRSCWAGSSAPSQHAQRDSFVTLLLVAQAEPEAEASVGKGDQTERVTCNLSYPAVMSKFRG